MNPLRMDLKMGYAASVDEKSKLKTHVIPFLSFSPLFFCSE